MNKFEERIKELLVIKEKADKRWEEILERIEKSMPVPQNEIIIAMAECNEVDQALIEGGYSFCY